MLGSKRLGAINEVRCLVTKLHDGSVCMLCWLAVLLKPKLVSVSDYIENMEYMHDRTFI